MLSSEDAVFLSRVLVPLLGLAVWGLFYLNARCAYRLPRGGKRTASQLFSVLASVGVFILQVNIMDRLSPKDARGSYLFKFIVIECCGALVLLFYTLFRERARSRKTESHTTYTPYENK